MSDVMQFVRELLEGKSSSVGVRGTVTHVIPVPTLDTTDPALYLFQIDVGGTLYSDMGFSRSPELQNMQDGEEIIAHMPEPESEGHPMFLVLSPVQVTTPTEVGPSEPEIDSINEIPFDADARDAAPKEDVAEPETAMV